MRTWRMFTGGVFASGALGMLIAGLLLLPSGRYAVYSPQWDHGVMAVQLFTWAVLATVAVVVLWFPWVRRLGRSVLRMSARQRTGWGLVVAGMVSLAVPLVWGALAGVAGVVLLAVNRRHT